MASVRPSVPPSVPSSESPLISFLHWMRNCSSWCSRVHIPDTSNSSFDSEVEEVVDDDAAASPDSSRRSGVLREAPEDGDDEEEDDAEALPALEGKEEEEDW